MPAGVLKHLFMGVRRQSNMQVEVLHRNRIVVSKENVFKR
jgi:hypothetical protein